MSKVKIILDEEEFNIEVEESDDAILEMAIEEDVDPPYSCRGGVCTTCKAKLISGTVKMDTNFALTDEEVAEGYILTCQSHPTSEEVTLTYDI